MSPLGRELADALGRDVVPHDLAVDVLLADAAGDELGVLRAEVEDQHALGGGAAIDGGGRRRDRVPWRSSCRDGGKPAIIRLRGRGGTSGD